MSKYDPSRKDICECGHPESMHCEYYGKRRECALMECPCRRFKLRLQIQIPSRAEREGL